MAENNSSAPLKTVPMIEAFEAAYSRDWNDPAGNEIKEIWHRAWQEAVAAQAAPAAEPLPLLVRDIARDIGISSLDACQALKGLGNFSVNSAVTADMARKLRECFPEATEDSSAGERATESVLIEGVAYTIPEPVALELLRLNIELQQAEVQAEPVDWDELPEDANERAMFDRNLDLYGGDPRVAIATALRLWANTRGNGSFGLMCAIYANEVAKMHIAAPQAQPADALDAKRWRAAAHDLSLKNLALVSVDDYGVCEMLTGDEANEAIDAAMAAAQEGGKA
ncbi:hypothetical protein [Comamonas sp.]|uniref:hypothetical protein n=1 Tax=Comamonas sp. TaxID=34028 RepID=UPI0028998515|nr:hypothetical protein [Comamonas sp.]